MAKTKRVSLLRMIALTTAVLSMALALLIVGRVALLPTIHAEGALSLRPERQLIECFVFPSRRVLRIEATASAVVMVAIAENVREHDSSEAALDLPLSSAARTALHSRALRSGYLRRNRDGVIQATVKADQPVCVHYAPRDRGVTVTRAVSTVPDLF